MYRGPQKSGISDMMLASVEGPVGTIGCIVGTLKMFPVQPKGLPNWRIPRPSMDFKHVRVIVWCWDFCSKMAHGIHEQMFKKSSRFQVFFFILG